MKKVKSLLFNWRQAGSIHDNEGCGEDYDKYSVGNAGVIRIDEYPARGEGDKWSYVVEMENGESARIFNPNYVEYFKEES